jgi:hypothetical protein
LERSPVPVTFENSSVVSVQVPDGRWFDVRITIDDGGWRIVKHGPFFGFAGARLALIGLAILRLVYWLRRSRLKAVEVVPWSTEVKGGIPVYREGAVDESAARAVARRVHGDLSRGDLVP